MGEKHCVVCRTFVASQETITGLLKNNRILELLNAIIVRDVAKITVSLNT